MIDLHRWNRAELYFTSSSTTGYTTEVFYCYKLRGHMPFFRANLIGLKADRDKKEIGTIMGTIRTMSCTRVLIFRTSTAVVTLKRTKLKVFH